MTCPGCSEGIPLTVIEAMAAGLPVVATDVGGVREVVEDGMTGHLVAARDDAGLAERIMQLAARPDLRRQLGQAGLARARSYFDESRMCDQYQSLYLEMCRV
jgi:glycosyltransferase involved in cell wall biosynthesis